MFGHDYFHDQFRKHAVLFGNLFNDLKVYRYGSDGARVQTLAVPIEYGPRRKTLERVLADPTFSRPATILPRLSYEFTTLTRAPARQLNRLNQRLARDAASNDALITQYQPVAYDLGVSMTIYAKNAYDLFQIVESILPVFVPEWNLSVRMVPATDKIDNIRITLDSAQPNDQYEGSMEERRVLQWTLNFTMHTQFYGDVTRAGLIKKVIIDFFALGGGEQITAEQITNAEAASRYTLTPGLTANGYPTSNPNTAIPYTQVKASDPYGFVEQWDDFTTGVTVYTPHTYTVQRTTSTGETQTVVIAPPTNFVPLAGGTMGGPLILNDDPDQAFGAATRSFVEATTVSKDVILVQQITTTSSSLTINLDNGEYVVLLLAHDISDLTITGWASGRVSKCTFDIRFQDDVSILDWTNVNWEGGDPPNLTGLSGRKDVISLYSPDGGGNIFGNIIGLDYRIA
jgi:hypothetical protein